MEIRFDNWDIEDDSVILGKYVAKKQKWESWISSSKNEASQTAERLKTNLINEFLKEEMRNLTKEELRKAAECLNTNLINEFLKEEMGNLTKEELRKAAEEMFPERFI